MCEKKRDLYFNCAEEDAVYALEFLRRRRDENGCSEKEKRQLLLMENRLEESRIYLAPAVIYAAANQKSSACWLQRADEKKQRAWYADGVKWMRRHPAFLECFGWKERRNAILTAGILRAVENGGSEENLRGLLRQSWRFLWERIRSGGCLDAESWKEMIEPWQDSVSMGSSMAGVLLMMAVLLNKPVYDRDQLWYDWQRLRHFCRECLEKPSPDALWHREPQKVEEEKMDWLFHHFKNPQRFCYIREKERFDSEWQDQLVRVMRRAGLPISACETVTLSCREVRMLLSELEGRMSPQKYMTFLALYTVSRELAQAGRAAAAQEAALPEKEIRT